MVTVKFAKRPDFSKYKEKKFEEITDADKVREIIYDFIVEYEHYHLRLDFDDATWTEELIWSQEYAICRAYSVLFDGNPVRFNGEIFTEPSRQVFETIHSLFRAQYGKIIIVQDDGYGLLLALDYDDGEDDDGDDDADLDEFF